MANVQELIGFNEAADQDSQALTNELFAVYGNDVVKVSTNTGYGFNLDSNSTSSFETFLNTIFFQNFNTTDFSKIQRPKTFDVLTGKWVTAHVRRCMNSKFMKQYKSRLFLGYCHFADPNKFQADLGYYQRNIFPSRVFYSDLLGGGELTWGVEYGSNGKIVPNSNILQLSQPVVQNFVTTNIKVGDPVFLGAINSGADPSAYVGQRFFVTSIDNPYQIRVDRNFPTALNGASGISFWVGSNWFDVAPHDGDSITGFGENNDRLLIYKLFSLFYYTGQQLKQVKGAVGTSSTKSVINDRKGNTYYFHGSDIKKTGIYKFDSVSSSKASRAIDPYIQGMDTTNYPKVVSWEEGDELRWFLGNITNTEYGISMTNAVATLNTTTNSWDVSPIDDIITCSTQWKVSGVQSSYCGAADSQVLKMGSGYSHNGKAIPSVVETGPRYPSSSEIINEYPYVQVIGRNIKGLRISYKRWDKPRDVDDRWIPLGECKTDLNEFEPVFGQRTSSGIEFRVEESGSLKNNWLVEKIALFYKPDRTRLA